VVRPASAAPGARRARSAGRRTAELIAADAYCRELASRHYENFAVMSRVLPERLRRDLARIYAYARTTDDLGDEAGADARAGLARWRDDVLAMFAGRRPVHPVLAALRETAAERSLPVQPFLDLIAANIQDQEVSRYAAWPDLRAYCMLSAAPVGRLVLRVFDVLDPAAERLSDDVCIGLQIANFAQDVTRDAAKGRTYLLQADLAAGGTEAAVRALCERARALLASGRELEGMVRWSLRVQLALYRLGGLAICDAIARCGYATHLRRPAVSDAMKVMVLARAIRQSLQRGRHARALEAA
jgi:squalene synthase HpnC